jgi:hypothetical protein
MGYWNMHEVSKAVGVRRSLGWVLLLSVAGTVACSTTASGLKARYAREQSCPVDQVSVAERGGTVYLANGCGNETEYVCDAFAGTGDSSTRCRERGLNPHEPMGDPPPQNPTLERPDLIGPK